MIQYWFFYPYNDGYNNHEGDWEHINVLLDSQDPNTANIIRVDFYFHKKVLSRNYPNFQFENNTHPIVYIGGTDTQCCGDNTGGSYPQTGHWVDVGPLGHDENVYGYGPVVHYVEYLDGNPNDGRGIVILKERDQYDYSQNKSMSWLNADIPWGHITVPSPWDWVPFNIGNHAPVGPAINKGWNRIGPVAGDYDLYSGLYPEELP